MSQNEAEISKLQKAFEEKAGWEKLTYDIDAWWIPEEGKIFKGQLVGHRLFNDDNGGKRVVYLIRSAMGIKAKPVGEPDQTDMPAGSIIAFGESWELQKLRPYVAKRGLVMLKCLGKDKRGKRSFWRYDVAVKGEKAPFELDEPQANNVASPTRRETESDLTDIDDLPF